MLFRIAVMLHCQGSQLEPDKTILPGEHTNDRGAPLPARKRGLMSKGLMAIGEYA